MADPTTSYQDHLTTVSRYTGREQRVPESSIGELHSGDLFEVVTRTRPAGAVSVFDTEHQVVIGYRTAYSQGIARIYDLDGREVGIDELPLQTPLLDPIDLILIGGSLVRIVSRGVVRLGAKLTGEIAGKSAMAGGSAAGLSILRLAIRRMTERELKFTVTTAEHMAEPGRYVPVSILKLAIRYGKRTPDPEGVTNAFRYEIQMLRSPKISTVPGGRLRQYTLEVVVDETDWTVLHFQFYK